MIVGYGIEEKEGNFRKDFLSNGKEAIKDFPTLSDILGDFPYFKEEKYDYNIFLVLASKSKYDIFYKDPNKEYYERLKQYEALLKYIKLNNLDRDRRTDITAKMKSFDKQQNHSIMLEFEFLRQLKEHTNIKNVIYNDFSESHHDYRISLDGIDFNLELTRLGESERNEILRNSLFKIAEELLKFIPTNKMLKIELKTDTLLNEEKKMNEKHIFDSVVPKIKKILPIILVKNNSFCTINTMGISSEKLYDVRDIYEHYNDLGERLALLCNTPEGEAYLKDTPLSIFDNFPVSSFDFLDAKFKIVEVHSNSTYATEILRESALLNRLEKSADYKLGKKQLLGQENSILIIYFPDILFIGYPYMRETLSRECLEKIKIRILNAFEKNPECNNILGIMLIEDSLANSKFVPNPNITIQTSVFSKLELISQII